MSKIILDTISNMYYWKRLPVGIYYPSHDIIAWRLVTGPANEALANFLTQFNNYCNSTSISFHHKNWKYLMWKRLCIGDRYNEVEMPELRRQLINKLKEELWCKKGTYSEDEEGAIEREINTKVETRLEELGLY